MRAHPFATVSLLFVLGACGTADPDGAPAADDTVSATRVVGTAALNDRAGNLVGNVTLSEENGQLLLDFEGQDLPSGTSGFHLHTTGLCESPDFTSAGGHLNPADNEHGADNPAGKHLGDLPNLVINVDGTASASLTVSKRSKEALAAIFDEDGTAVMIHADADDYATDPTGNAGSRIACGVLQKAS
ncbi:superoxide dismutase family protein [Erythrobacter sp. HA6-11]